MARQNTGGNQKIVHHQVRGLFKKGGGGQQGSTKLVSVVSRIPDKLLMVRQMAVKITTKKVGPNP